MVTREKTGMPLDEFLEQNYEQPFELINGERRPVLPNVFGHSFIIRLLFRLLDAFALSGQFGEVFAETTFVLPDADDADWVTGSRIPDVMFYAGNRIAEYKAAASDWRSRPIPLVPDFVIEVVSPNDKFSDLDEKVDAYLADGVRLIWVIDPQRHKAIVHAPDMEQPRHLAGDAVLDGEEVIPGFQVVLSELFK
jgi:Uma2 family endonuclease